METTEDFTKKLGAMITATVLSAGISLGNDLNLFDLILSNPDPMTSTQIAEKGNFKERYIISILYVVLFYVLYTCVLINIYINYIYQ